MKAPRLKFQYLLIAAVILVQTLVSGFVFIPDTGFDVTVSDALVDPIQANPDTSTKTVDSSNSESKASLQKFVDTVADGESNVIRGIYAEEVLEYPVIQQPSGQAGYVSAQTGIVTQFSMPNKYGVTGLLAHNYAAGASFFSLEVGDVVQVVYGDGTVQEYEIQEMLEYQALSPNSATSSFVDLDTGAQLSATQLFKRVYTGNHHLTLQTCIQVGSEDSWGRLFIIANPVV